VGSEGFSHRKINFDYQLVTRGPPGRQNLFTLRTVPPRLQGLEGDANGAARAGGFSLHAGVDIAPNQREKLARLSLRKPATGGHRGTGADCIGPRALEGTGIQANCVTDSNYRSRHRLCQVLAVAPDSTGRR
jgi:hypothetical protein